MRSTFSSRVGLALPWMVVAFACGSAEERRGWDQTTTPSPNGPVPAFSNSTDPNAAKADSTGASTYVPPTELGCSSRAQDILIVDFRSGWWAGGGGGGFTNTALSAVVGACPLTSVDYHHFEIKMHVKCVYKSAGGGGCQELAPAANVDDIRKSFERKVADYTQIWVLSGSDSDQSDIPVGDALFQGVVADTRGACIPMLVAGGDGFVTHANTITTDFGLGNVFASKTNPPGFFMAGLGVKGVSSVQGAGLGSHLLFKSVNSITDRVASMMQQAHGDSLAESVPGPHIYQAIAHDDQGNATVAVGAAKVTGDGYRPFVFDSGWQRMYTLGQDPGTDQYLKNLVMYMGLVGCKAAPIGTPK